ncbi:alpha/beta fold hydrolase [Robertkochia solimangrovi]|uniref:alpha/beta fold hydrolase n=1 Tax=Robertkochia solimangrovi TaxID=2213046 RepID=UPI00117FED03|nr:alpha/beta hydrolase [Robertkochia solimangrovi]TRZ46343.1 hypothetical protein DMZ48_03560 [Robertkochia solimangrovi]
MMILLNHHISSGQTEEAHFKSKFIEVNGLNTHYLDFGGQGIPLILVHSEAWDAYTYKNFGPFFTGNNRVMAITRPGYGGSAEGSYKVENQANHLISFIDAFGFDKAIFMGNSSVTAELTCLAENYPDRIAGLVYLNGLGVPWLDVHLNDPLDSYEMYSRASPGANSEKNDRNKITSARKQYIPKLAITESFKIKIKALAIVAENGRQGYEAYSPALLFVGSPLLDELRSNIPPSPTRDFMDRFAEDTLFRDQWINSIQDTTARSFFNLLKKDTTLQNEIHSFYSEIVYPETIAAEDRFIKAFGKNLKFTRIKNPMVSGYEYRDSPELIIEAILQFLNELD